MSLSLIIASLFGPNTTWDFKPGQLDISQELRGLSTLQTFGSADFAAISIKTEAHDGSADTFVLKCIFTNGIVLKPLNSRGRWATSMISILMSTSQHFKDPLAHRKSLKSPAFATFKAAETAREMLLG